jgi:hypothetical protein
MDWLKKQLYRLKVGVCVVLFGVGLLIFIGHLVLFFLGEGIMKLAVVHCPDMIAKFGR